MNRQRVESSNLSSVGYDESSNVLEVEFNHGGIYQYSNVPSHLYEGLMAANSHGTFFDEKIKKGGFPYKKVG